jgi:hypothetical protein
MLIDAPIFIMAHHYANWALQGYQTLDLDKQWRDLGNFQHLPNAAPERF